MTNPDRDALPKAMTDEDRELADDLSEHLQRATNDDPNVGAAFRAFLRARPTVQKLVILLHLG